MSRIRTGLNDRKVFDQVELEGLAASIAKMGLISPILVRPDGPGSYRIVAGERRFRAHQLLGKEVISALVATDDDDQTASLKMLAENTGRKNLNPIEEAQGYQSRIDEFGVSVEELAAAAGRTVRQVQISLAYLKLVPEAQGAMITGELGTGNADALIGLDEARQRAVLSVAGRLDHDGLWTLCTKLRAQQDQESMFDEADFALNAEEWVAEASAQTLVLGIKKLAKMVDELFDGLDMDGLVAGRPDKERLLAQVKANLDYRVRGIAGDGYVAAGSRTVKL